MASGGRVVWMLISVFTSVAVSISELCGILDQRSAIVGDTLYFSSGNYTFDDGLPWHNTSSFYSINLNTTLDVSGPIPLSLLNQSPLPSAELAGGVSPIAGGAAGTFFYDHTTLYAYGGIIGGEANGTQNGLWTYNLTTSSWGLTIVEGGQLSFGNVTEGLYANDPAHSVSFYTGGYGIAYNDTNNGMVRLDTSDPASPQWSFETAVNTMQTPDMLKGYMVYVRRGKAGILVAFGGYNTTSKGTEFGPGWDWDQRPLSDIFVYDIYSNTWYLVEATGDIPHLRSEFCAGVSSAPDDSSFQITMHGGWDQFSDTAFGDVYVLTLPAFEWIQVDAQNNPDGQAGRNRLKCNMFNDGQMIVSGGGVAGTSATSCNSSAPPIKVLDTSQYVWRTQFDPSLNYTVPSVVTAVVGGNSSGHATVTAPSGGWNNTALQSIWAISVPRDSYNYNNSSNSNSTSATASPGSNSTSGNVPGSTAGKSDDHKGAIIGGVIGGLVLVALIVFAVWRRRTRTRNTSKDAGEHSQKWTKAELGDGEVRLGSTSRPGELDGYSAVPQLATKDDRAELDSRTRTMELPGEEAGPKSPVEMDGRG